MCLSRNTYWIRKLPTFVVEMPGILSEDSGSKKRKRVLEATSKSANKARKAPKKSSSSDDTPARILLIEEKIKASREHYNDIKELQAIVQNVVEAPEHATIAAVALCRVFSRFHAGGDLVKRKTSSEDEVEVIRWLKSQLREYVGTLSSRIGSPDAVLESTALTLIMRLVKAETSAGRMSGEQSWKSEGSTFTILLQRLLSESNAEAAREEFVEKYVERYDDVRFYTFTAIRQIVRANQTQQEVLDNALDILIQITGLVESEHQFDQWYGVEPESKKHQLHSLSAHLKGARAAWLAMFESPLSSSHRKVILGVLKSHLLPWFADHIELLTDFLTDSFNKGGSSSLLALNGIFQLMTQKNIDYPDFYTKLYSLLDEDIMHSKHRSRFFRLLESFMASTHLPAALVASFIKRLSRLALHAPPGAIVWAVPWIYNMLKQHPQCTFMIHRTYHPAHAIYAAHPKYNDEGMDDPFDMEQRDPVLTRAIDSSLWELETLRSHYHPNVATLAKIIGEQFTKREYQLEDFLDHSYTSLIDADLGKEMKKTPVVEWEIPKRIFTSEDGGLDRIGELLQGAINAC